MPNSYLYHIMPAASLIVLLATAASAADLSVLERDVLQSRNMTLVVNHTTAMGNLTDGPMQVSVESDIPPDLDRSGNFWPSFGRQSLASLPQLPGAATAVILGQPARIGGARPAYAWQTALAPKQWAIASYSNYWGPAQALLVSPRRQQVLALLIESDYSIVPGADQLKLRMDIALSNSSDRPLRDVQFRLCFPETLAGDAKVPPRRLLQVRQHWVEGAADYGAIAHADGFGRRVSIGHAATLTVTSLMPLQTMRFSMLLQVVPPNTESQVAPAYLIGFRESEGGERIWPASRVSPKPSGGHLHRTYAREAALLIPAPALFALGGAATAKVAAWSGAAP